MPFDRFAQMYLAKPFQQRAANRDRSHTDQASAYARMCPGPQCELSRSTTCQIHSVRVGKTLRVPICSNDSQYDALSRANPKAIEVYVLDCFPEKNTWEASIAKQLLNSLLCQTGFLVQHAPLLRISQ